jgi:5-methyltetrahydropteroyltriglutamate--homocysteine methyltransferase
MGEMASEYRADHVGSLLRPPEVLEARAAHAEGRLGLDGLREVEDRAILGALELQREVGIGIYTDGEFRRGSWLTDMADAVEGFVPDRVMLDWHGPGAATEGSTAQVAGARLRQARRLTGHEVGFLKAHAPGPIKMTLPCPSNFMLSSYKPGVSDQYYPTRADLLRDLTAIVRDEVRALVDEGVAYIQLDAPYYSHFVDQRIREHMRQGGVDPDEALDQAIAADDACLEGARRADVTLALHVCRGNNRSRWYTEGGYEPIAEKLFGGLRVHRLLLEYDSERAGGFEPLRYVPGDRTVVLGLITTKEPQLESQDALLRRVDEAARYVPAERLALSPQCGFASTAAGNLLTPDDQRRKLELVVETARKVWG